jgi:hypothetical protein
MNPIGKAICFLLFCLVINPVPLSAAEPVVRLNGDRMTLAARDTNLCGYPGVAGRPGHPHSHRSRINPTVTATFTNRPIGPAIASILKSVDYALIWRKDKASTAGEPRLWEIRIFYKGQEARIRPLQETREPERRQK